MLRDLAEAAAPLLACVLGVAGVAKLRRPASTRAAARAMGVPSPLVRPLPLVELALAALLLVRPALAGACAAALLILFTVLVVRTLRRGVAVSCGCFGGADDRPLNSGTVVRNVGLVGSALVCAFGPATLHRPTLAAVIAVSTSAVAVAAVSALAGLRHEVGPLFATTGAVPQ